MISVVELEQSETKMKFLTFFTIFSMAVIGPISAIPGLLDMRDGMSLAALRKRLPAKSLTEMNNGIQSMATGGFETVKNSVGELTNGVTSMANDATQNVSSGISNIGYRAVIAAVKQYLSRFYERVLSYIQPLQTLVSNGRSWVGL